MTLVKKTDKYPGRTARRHKKAVDQRAAGIVPMRDKRDDTTPKKYKISATRRKENAALRIAPGEKSKPLLAGVDPNAVSPNPDKPLTEKQFKFAQALAKGISVGAASREAGYNDRSSMGRKMVKSPAVMKVVDRERELYKEACHLTREAVMEGMKEAIDMAKLQSEPATMIAGWRQIALLCGYYAPAKVEVALNVNDGNAMSKLNLMTDAQLIEVMQGESGRLIEGEVIHEEDRLGE